ncbi:hypothetical protein F4781DRAFT_260419 [Annulohypoxylon bovei var. microspora]|nr:hypothetical protein F4781DRAFT_260419 [Annulohypoxylon bovei var. microspora]
MKQRQAQSAAWLLHTGKRSWGACMEGWDGMDIWHESKAFQSIDYQFIISPRPHWQIRHCSKRGAAAEIPQSAPLSTEYPGKTRKPRLNLTFHSESCSTGSAAKGTVTISFYPILPRAHPPFSQLSRPEKKATPRSARERETDKLRNMHSPTIVDAYAEMMYSSISSRYYMLRPHPPPGTPRIRQGKR